MIQYSFRLFALAALIALAAGCTPRPAPLMGVLLVADGQDAAHTAALTQLGKRLTHRGEISVQVTRDFSTLTPPALNGQHVLVFCPSSAAPLSPAAREALLQHVRAGGGLVAMSAALSAYCDWPEWPELVGGLASPPVTNGPSAENGSPPLTPVESSSPPLTKGGPGGVNGEMHEYITLDTAHAAMLGVGGHFEMPAAPVLIDRLDPAAEILARTASNLSTGHPEPQIWTRHVGHGRVMAIAFGRDDRAYTDEWYITLLHNAIRWTGHQLPDTRHNVLTAAERQEGYELLFNGHDLTGWPEGQAHWTVDNGDLVGQASDLAADAFLISAREYGDFELRFSVRLTGGQGNSGLVLRCGRRPDRAVLGFEADVAAGRYGTISEEGGQRGVLAEGWKDKGEHVAILDGWNDIEVHAQGGKINLSLNGLPTAEYHVSASDPQPAGGPIALELHRNMSMEVRYRDMRIKRLNK